MGDHYILGDDHKPIEVDLLTWAGWFEANQDKRRVAIDRVNGKRVSTVFLGLNLNLGDGPPLLFETMIFEGDGYSEEYCDRYSTWDQAIAGHAKAIELVKGNTQ